MLAFILPITWWKIIKRNPDITWQQFNEILPDLKYEKLTGNSPYYVNAPGGIVKNGKLFGGTIKVNGFEYRNGFFMNGNAEIGFKLNGEYDYFEAEVGIEQGADPGGDVFFYVAADENTGYIPVKYGEGPVHIKIDLDRCQVLILKTIGNPSFNRWYNRGIWGGPIVGKD